MNAVRTVAPLCLALFAAACSPSPSDNGNSVTNRHGLSDVRVLPVGTRLPGLTAGPDGPALLFAQEFGASASLRWAGWNGMDWMDTLEIHSGTDLLINWADRPAMAFGPDGEAHAHWLEVDPRGDFTYGIRTVHSTDGGRTWSEPDRPHGDTAVAEHGFGQWMLDGRGTMFAWLDGRRFDGHPNPAKAPMEVRAAQWRADSGWSEEIVLDTSACTCCPLAAAPTADGYLLAYRDRTPEEIRDFSGVTLRASTEGPPRVVFEAAPLGHDGWQIAGCPVNGSALATAGDLTLALWFTNAQDTARIRSAWRHSDGTWSAVTDLQQGPAVGRVAAATDGQGRFHGIWMERREAGAVLVGQCWSAEGEPLLPDPVELTGVDDARAGGFPTAVGLDSGGIVLAWTSTGKEARVHTARWTPSP